MSLQYNVAQLLKSEVGQTRTYDFESDMPIDLGEGEATQIHGQVKFILTNFGVIARGDASATLHLVCARCLEPFEMTANVSFEEEFQPVIDIATGLPAAAPRADTAFVINPNHTIDLTETLRQNLVLAVEIIPVCRPDCKGLCPTCGANRNTETCACPTAEDSSPFAVLEDLLAGAEVE